MFPAKLNRIQFLAHNFAWSLVLNLGLMPLFELHVSVAVLWLIACYIYFVRHIAAARMRSAGMNPHYLWLLLVPLVSIVIVMILCFERPVKDESPSQALEPASLPKA